MRTWEVDWGDHQSLEVARERVIDCKAGHHSAVIPCHCSVFLGDTGNKNIAIIHLMQDFLPLFFNSVGIISLAVRTQF